MATDHSLPLGEDAWKPYHPYGRDGTCCVYELEVTKELGVDKRQVSLGVYGSRDNIYILSLMGVR